MSYAPSNAPLLLQVGLSNSSCGLTLLCLLWRYLTTHGLHNMADCPLRRALWSTCT